jgi:hypothetical protein
VSEYIPPSPPTDNAVTSPPPNYLVFAILVTIFCCLPLGIVAIVFAAQVNSKANAGDYEGAAASSRKAKTWCWVALIVGIIWYVGWIVVTLLTSSLPFFLEGFSYSY